MGLNNNPSQPAYLIPGLPSAMGATKVVATDASGNLAAYSVSGTGTTVALTESPVFSTDITANTVKVGRGPNPDVYTIAIGYQALNATVTASQNTAIGYQAMLNNQSGSSNVVVGQSNLQNSVTGSYNVAVGTACLRDGGSVTGNTAVGYLAGLSASANYNIFLGYGAGNNVSNSGTANVMAGLNCGTGVTSGSYNVILGGVSGSAAPISATGGFNIVFSDGAGNLRGYFDSNGTLNYGLGSTTAAAPTIASATTIAPTTRIVFISGTTAIATITPPSGGIANFGGQITLIPTGLWTTTTAGNIALATTAVVSKALIMTYDAVTAKWYPSY